MRRRHFIAGLGATVALRPAHSQVLDATEVLEFQSTTYTDFRQLVSRQAPTSTITISAELSFPDQARERYSALVIVHTIGGYQESNEGWHVIEFRKAGFATLTYDSFFARGVSGSEAMTARPEQTWASAVADAFAALQLLARHPKIDPNRIAIVGFSFGGEI